MNSNKHREQSRIKFPYGRLSDAEKVAHGVFQQGEFECHVDTLTERLGLSKKIPTFNQWLSTAKTFGVIQTHRGLVQLTGIGRDIVDPRWSPRAKTDAFLHVELYKAIYDKYKDIQLPNRKDLEKEIETLGVSPKQTDKARQAFMRSAEQAGFFRKGSNQLVRPLTQRRPTADETATPFEAEVAEATAETHTDQSTDRHPFIVGLMETLPEPGVDWSAQDRVQWLQTAANIFSLIYKGQEAEIVIKRAETKG